MRKSLKLVTLKKSLAAFSMKVTTTPRDCYKVNKIFPIMQEHLSPVMNLVRIKLLAFVLHALCVVQTVSLHKIASAMPTSVERDSNLRRVQRFLAGYVLNLDLISKVIFALLPSSLSSSMKWLPPPSDPIALLIRPESLSSR